MVDRKAVGAALRAQRESRTWSRPELVRRLQASAAPEERQRMPPLPALVDMIKDWEKGKYLPRLHYRRLYSAVFGIRVEVLFSDAPVVQDELGQAAGADLWESLQTLDEDYLRVPSALLLGPASQVHGRIGALREQTRSFRALKELHRLQAASAVLMNQLVWDASQRRDHEGSLLYLDQAIRCARSADDPYTEAYATLRVAFIDLYGRKDPDRGVIQARRAAEIAGRRSPALRGLALLHIAEGHARKRDREACEEALGEAEGQLDLPAVDDQAETWLTPSEVARLSGSCYLALGLADKAEPFLRKTVADTGLGRKNAAIALGNLALALIRRRILDEAVATLHLAIDAVEETRGGGGLNLVFAAGRALQPWRNEPDVYELNDRLLTLMASD